jgi:pyruvate dehydrogenase E1 component
MDKDGLLKKRMEECVDGEYQNFKAKGGAYTREHFFGKYPELKEMVAAMSDQDIWRLNRGGHDPHKVYAAYHSAVNHKGQPTVILAKTVKGYGMGEAGEGQNITHQQKSMDLSSLKAFRDRFDLPITDEQVESLSFYKPAADSPEMVYMAERRAAMGGSVPSRRRKGNDLVSASYRLWCVINNWVNTLCLSYPMRRALLVWRACSVNWVFMPAKASCTSLWIPIR